ncbi:MAG: alanine racemase [Bacilli bacterium]|nr:alanine racemase [Bacilli bacterium]
MYRRTYAEINHQHLTENIKEIKKYYSNYQYYIGVVKNNAYHHGIKCVNALKDGGINYFAVSSLEEALELRKYNLDTPVLILEPIDLEYIYDCINNNITITVDNLKYVEVLEEMNLPYELKIHLKLDTGMNRLGFKIQTDLEQAIKIIEKNKKMILEGIYSHFATSGTNDPYWDSQKKRFEELTQNIDLSKIPIVHLGRSLTLVNHDKISFCNGIRLGIVMYGFSQSKKVDQSIKSKLRTLKLNYFKKKQHISDTTLENPLKLKTAFTLYSEVLSVRNVSKGEFVGYNANYKIKEDSMLATIPIGYADGVEKNFEMVMINHKKYPIVADSMDMIMVMVDNNVQEGMAVEIFGKHIAISDVTKRIGKNAYHLFNQIQNRVPRIHVINEDREETKY